MKAIIFSNFFEGDDDFIDFCKGLGYEPYSFHHCFDLMFDQRVIEYCEQRLEKLQGEMVFKGKPTSKVKIGFAGAGFIREIDTSKSWRIYYDKFDTPVIDYVKINRNEYGYISIGRG